MSSISPKVRDMSNRHVSVTLHVRRSFVLHTASYASGCISERCACLIVLTCSDCIYFGIFPWCFCFYNGWVGHTVKWFILLLTVLRSETLDRDLESAHIVLFLKLSLVLYDEHLDEASIKHRIGACTPQSRAETRFWDASETHRGSSDHKHCLEWLRIALNSAAI